MIEEAGGQRPAVKERGRCGFRGRGKTASKRPWKECGEVCERGGGTVRVMRKGR